MYTKDLETIARSHGFSIHLYADDTQLYIEFNPLYEDIDSIEVKVIECLEHIKAWMTINKLKLNPGKTEVMSVQARNNFSSWSLEEISLTKDGDPVVPMQVVKSLGVKLDAYLTFEDHIDSIVKSCNIHLRNLGVLASKLSYQLRRQLVHCLVLSKLDYCNSLLFGLPESSINKLQKIENSCVRFLFGYQQMKKWDSVTPFLKKAHFLPIKERIEYKVALLAFKCINNIAPSYLAKCIKIKDQPMKTLRTDSDYFLLQVPAVPKLKRTERSFSHCAPLVWNKLPYSLRTKSDIGIFKRELKTHLFRRVFGEV